MVAWIVNFFHILNTLLPLLSRSLGSLLSLPPSLCVSFSVFLSLLVSFSLSFYRSLWSYSHPLYPSMFVDFRHLHILGALGHQRSPLKVL